MGSDLFVKVLTIAANLAAGIFMLAEADSELFKVMAVGLVLVGVGNFPSLFREVRVPAARMWLQTHAPMTDAGVEKARLELDMFTAERRLELGHAAIFYIALLVGVGGLAACAIGLAHNIYAATLSGSLIASLGFVTVACVLVAAEHADDPAQMALDPNGGLGKLFDKLVKNKMSAIAIPVAGLSVSFAVLTFSKAFSGAIGDIMAGAGLSFMLFMLAMFTVASTVLVWRNLREPPKAPPARGPGGQLIKKPNDQPVENPARDPSVMPAVSATS